MHKNFYSGRCSIQLHTAEHCTVEIFLEMNGHMVTKLIKKTWLLAIGKMAKHESKGSYGQICQNLTWFVPNVT